jgi:hypothetical protein
MNDNYNNDNNNNSNNNNNKNKNNWIIKQKDISFKLLYQALSAC